MLHSKHCIPCEQGTSPLDETDSVKFLSELDGWKIVDRHIEKSFKFPDFKTGLEFVNKIGELAEAEGHHPDIFFGWGKVKVELWTHVANGLTENDFILAAKIDRL